MMTACAYAGVCPRLLVTPWAASVVAACNWWEHGALGTDYLTAPSWVHGAFGIIGSARVQASMHHSAEKRKG